MLLSMARPQIGGVVGQLVVVTLHTPRGGARLLAGKQEGERGTGTEGGVGEGSKKSKLGSKKLNHKDPKKIKTGSKN